MSINAENGNEAMWETERGTILRFEARVLAVTIAIGILVVASTAPVSARNPMISNNDLGHKQRSTYVQVVSKAKAKTKTKTVTSPVPASSKISSPFGMRMARRSKKRLFHAGLDFRAKQGTPVFSARAGIVEVVARDEKPSSGFKGYGNAVVVYHEDEDRWSFFAHLAEVTVTTGQKVEAGDNIGTVGATNNGRFKGMGAHLHFEVRVRQESGDSPFPGPYRVSNIDPRTWLADHGVEYDRKGYLVMPTETDTVDPAAGEKTQLLARLELHEHQH